MDIVFHRSCMDGAFSAYLMYMFCKTTSVETYKQFISHLKSHTSHELQPFQSEQILLKPCQKIEQQFFHTKPEVPFHSVSMYAGDLFPIAPSANGNILFMLDISPNTKEMMVMLAQRFTYVIIIDHHATFLKCQQTIRQNKLKNVLYFWNEKKCAAQLVEEYLFNSFGFPKNFPKKFQQNLAKQIQYVAGNDLKVRQDRASKQFTLGFYYFQIDLSHQNPLLFKRIWSLDMETILKKGQCAYKDHIDLLIHEVQNCEIYKIIKSKYQNMFFLGTEMSDRGLTSDLGSILAYLSTKFKFENLALIYKKGPSQVRISFRSYQFVEQKPKALELSEFYGGGGHLCAAGCTVAKGIFKQHFKSQGKIKPPLKITKQQIESILFKGGN